MSPTYVRMLLCMCIRMFDHCYYTTTALSVTDSNAAITVVDISSCARRLRSHDHKHISEYLHMSTPPRLPDPTHIGEFTHPKSLYSRSSTSVGEFYHHCVSCV